MATAREWGWLSAVLIATGITAAAQNTAISLPAGEPSERLEPSKTSFDIAERFDLSQLSEPIVPPPKPTPKPPASLAPPFAKTHRLIGIVVGDGIPRALVSRQGEVISLTVGAEISDHTVTHIGTDHILAQTEEATVRLELPVQREAQR